MPNLKEKAWRNDAFAKVTGTAKYADDIKVPNLLHAVPVYSDYVHARIFKIHTEKAKAMPGIISVLTSADVPGKVCFGQIEKDYHMLADDKIRYNGDVIAIVVAESKVQAIEAAKYVTLDAEPLPLILDPEKALLPDSILVHEDMENNLINEHRVRTGNVEKGFEESDHILEYDFKTPYIEHAYLEPESAVCIPRADGVIEIYGSMQHPFSTRRFIATILGEPLANVEVITIPMGGGFGGKDDTAAIVCARTALAARLTGRPVKMTYEREWSVRESYKRHPYNVHYKMGITNDGYIRSIKCRIVADGGPYCSVTPWVTWRSTVQCCGPYMVPNVHCDTLGVYTNNIYTGAMRGFGSPQMNFIIEQLVEMAAEKTGMNAIEFRKKNMVRQDSVTITGQHLTEHKVSLDEVLEAVLKEIDYEEKYKQCSHGKGSDEQYGIGLAISYRGMSLGGEGKDFCAAIINVQFDGSILLEVGVHENGQGSESAMIKILAEELGVPVERIRYRRNSTSNIPDSGTTVASRGTIMGGGAVVIAANQLKDKIAETILPPDIYDRVEIEYYDDKVYFGSNPMTWQEVVNQMYQKQQFPYAFGVFGAPKVSWDEETGQGNPYFTWVYACQAVELKVNPQSGKVTLLNAVAAHDVGKAVNRSMLEGQFYGGMVMGMGYGLFENFIQVDGKIKTLNFNNYKIARSTDVPEMTAIIVENHDPLSPSGAKGIGEPTNEIMAPAIANAIYNATGKRHLSNPIILEQEVKK
jgi:CO/xanthine dehydrogenase Mo-binding subunit